MSQMIKPGKTISSAMISLRLRGFSILILILILSHFIDTHIFLILAQYINFEGAKNIFNFTSQVLEVQNFGHLRILTIPDWSLASWFLFEYAHWLLIQSYYKFRLSILILKMQGTSMSLKSIFGSLEDAECSCLGFLILILIWMWSLVFDRPMFQICSLSPDFKHACP